MPDISNVQSQFIMASDVITLISLIIVMFLLFMVLDSTLQKLSVA